jgi:hypothetical protein
VNIYDQSKKSFSDRKQDNVWREISSKAGFIADGELFLPEQILKNPDLRNCDLIIIEDDNKPEQKAKPWDMKMARLYGESLEPKYNYCFRLTQPNRYHIFEIRVKGEMELHLRYEHFQVGIPKRNDFKIGEVRRNKPIEVKINGKTDFTMSGWKNGRAFKEQHYLIEYVGDFEKCKILKKPYEPIAKTVPVERKVVDLIKPLW